MGDKLGTIEPNKLADIVASDENPLKNIKTLETSLLRHERRNRLQTLIPGSYSSLLFRFRAGSDSFPEPL